MSYTAKDAALSLTRALPNGAATVTSTSLDTRNGTRGDFTAPAELLIEAPAVTTAMNADAATIRYDVIGSTAADLSNPVTLATGVLTQTGAGGAGSAAAKARFGIPSNTPRYLGLSIVKSGAGNASTVSATASLVT